MTTDWSCKDCTNRHVNCHAECEIYKKENEEHQKRNSDLRKQKDMYYAQMEFRRDMVRKAMRSKMNREGKFGERR